VVIPEAAEEARWASSVAGAENRPLVRFGDDTALLLPRTPTEAHALVTRILGQLIAQDAEHGTDYVNTLRAMLVNDRSWQSAAAELHIHKQTLGYRIRKISQLTGRGLTRTDDLAEWWFALRAYDLLNGRSLDLTPEPACGGARPGLAAEVGRPPGVADCRVGDTAVGAAAAAESSLVRRQDIDPPRARRDLPRAALQ
jgi:PucR C-terminal helix-turn-helix domain